MPVYSYKTKNGNRWLFKVCVGGRQYLRRGYRTKMDAKQAEIRFMLDDSKNFSDPLLSEVVYSYLKIHGEILKFSSKYRLEGKIKNYILGKLKDKPISRYSFLELNLWWDSIKKEPLKNKNEVLGILNAIFHHAQVYFNFTGHEFEKLVPYRDFSIKPVEPLSNKKYLTVYDFKKIYSLEKDPFFQVYLLVSFFLGMRISEVRGLQRKCYDGKYLYVYQQVQGKSGLGSWLLTSLKTDSSSRIYLLPMFLRQRLDDHIKKYHLDFQSFIFFGKSKKDKMHLEPISENSIVRELKRLSSESGISFSSHSFRHSEATLLNEEGVSADQIGEYLGHSSSEVTKKHYIHETVEHRQSIADLLDAKYQKIFS